MVVVDAVDDEVHAAAEGVVGLPVEDEPVQPVLGQGPDRDPGLASAAPGSQGLRGRDRPPATPWTTTTGMKIHRGDGGVDAGEEVEEFALEERGGCRELLGAVVGLHLAQC